jgi:hypothetical protein
MNERIVKAAMVRTMAVWNKETRQHDEVPYCVYVEIDVDAVVKVMADAIGGRLSFGESPKATKVFGHVKAYAVEHTHEQQT